MTPVETPIATSGKNLHFWKTEHFRAALLIIGILLIVYRDVVFGGRTFLVGPHFPGVTAFGPYGDPAAYVKNQYLSVDAGAIAWQMEPWEKMINQMYAKGEAPLWNPHSGLGYPFYANPHSAPFDPLMMLIYIAPEVVWTVMVDFHLLFLYFLGAFFLYLFMRQLGVSVGAALFTGIGFVLSTYFWAFTTISFARADLLLPMLIYSYHRLANFPSRKNAAFAILALWLIIVTGFPETLTLHIGIASLWFVLQIVLNSRTVTSYSRKQFLLMLGLLAVVIVTSILLGAFILIPFFEFFQIADHFHAPNAAPIVANLWTLFQSLARLLEPLPDKIMVTANVNILVWILAIYAALQPRQLSAHKTFYARFFILFALIMALVIFQAPLFVFIAQLPILNMISLQRFVPIFITLCATCGAGIGLDLWMSQKRHKIDKLLVILSVILVLSLLVGFFIPSLDDTLRNAFIQDFILVILVVIVFHIINFLISRRISSQTGMVLIVALLVLSPQSWSSFTQRPERYDPFVAPPFIHYLQSQSNQPYRVLGLDSILYPNTAGVFGIDDVRYLDALIPASLARYTQELIFKPTEPVRFSGTESSIQFGRGLNLLNVEYIIADASKHSFERHVAQSQVSEGQFEQVYKDDKVIIYRNKAAFPRAFVVHQFELVKNTDEAISRLKDPSFDPSQSVLIEGNFNHEPLPQSNSPTSSQAVITNRTTNSMSMDVTTEKAGILVVSEQSFPGWEAYVDGQPTEILTANATMRAVYLEAGKHTVEFRFNPLSFRIGLAISGVILLVMVAIYLFFYIRQRRSEVL